MEIRPLDRGLSQTPRPPSGFAPERTSKIVSSREFPMNRMRTLPTIRFELVQEARAKIAAGFYDSPKVLESVVETLIADRGH